MTLTPTGRPSIWTAEIRPRGVKARRSGRRGLLGRLPLITIGACAISCGLISAPNFSKLLEYDMPLLQRGELWRAATCHLTHVSPSHLFWSGLAFLILGSICETRDRHRFGACLLISAIGIALSLFLFLPTIRIYRGLSGIDSALFILAVVLLHRDNHRDSSIPISFVWLALCLFLGKIVCEFLAGESLFFSPAPGIVLLPLAHLSGAAAGLVSTALPRLDRNATAAKHILLRANPQLQRDPRQRRSAQALRPCD